MPKDDLDEFGTFNEGDVNNAAGIAMNPKKYIDVRDGFIFYSSYLWWNFPQRGEGGYGQSTRDSVIFEKSAYIVPNGLFHPEMKRKSFPHYRPPLPYLALVTRFSSL